MKGNPVLLMNFLFDIAYKADLLDVMYVMAWYDIISFLLPKQSSISKKIYF